MKCRGCGQSLQGLMLLALMEDAGARVYPSVLYCSEGVEHDFFTDASTTVTEKAAP